MCKENCCGGAKDAGLIPKEKCLDWRLLNEEVKDWETTTKLVISDMKKREAFGLQKYGKALSKDTDEDMMNHLYEELLDGAVYIRTLMEQRKYGM